jgi:twitching motility protein PilT
MRSDTHSWQVALRSVLREDPDVVLVGEMRDFETISAAMTIAETGHLVFGTLHTNSAPSTMTRIIDVFPPSQQDQIRSQLASTLRCVVTQRLFKRVDGAGRVGAFEVMICNQAIKNLIRENKIPQIGSMIQVGSKFGMISMKDYLQELIKENKISVDDAEQVLSLVTDTPDFEEATEVLSKVTNDKKSVLESGNYKNSFVKKVEDNF